MLQPILICGLIFIFRAAAQNDPNCGTKGPEPPENAEYARIIGGEEAHPLEFPWQCYLMASGASCGCTLLNSKWILSAAHCVFREDAVLVNAEDIQVIAGKHSLYATDKTEVNLKVIQTIVYPTYNHTDHNFLGDAVLLKLERELDFYEAESHLGTICLPDKEDLDLMAGQNCIATGWGNVDHRYSKENPGLAGEVLMKVTSKIVPQGQCAEQREADDFSELKICIHSNGKATCSGDSGGPLQCYRDGRWFQFGVTSHGLGECGNPHYPDVFARTSEISQWIWDKISENNK